MSFFEQKIALFVIGLMAFGSCAAQKGDLCVTPFPLKVSKMTSPQMVQLHGNSKIVELSVENLYFLAKMPVLDWKLQIEEWSGGGRTPEYESQTFRFETSYFAGHPIMDGGLTYYQIHWKPTEVPGSEMFWEDQKPLNDFEKSLSRYFCDFSEKGGAVYRMIVDEDVLQLEFQAVRGNGRLITKVFRL